MSSHYILRPTQCQQWLSHPHSRVDRAFFDFWTPQLAWLLGLIWTDGCLSSDRIIITAKGRQIPETVQWFVGYDVPIKPKHGKPGCFVIEFSDVAVANFLRALGLIPAKSFTITWPEIPKRLRADFVRGILDGDGWVSVSTRRRAVGFCGASPSFGRSLSAWLKDQQIQHRVEFDRRGESSASMWRILINRVPSLLRLHRLLYRDPLAPCHEAKRLRYSAILEFIDVNRVKEHRRKPAKRPEFGENGPFGG